MTGSDNPLTAAVAFFQGALAGSVATAAAVVAVAGVGFLMLSGRLDVRRSAIAILGCFIVFGAATIASGIETAIFGTGEPVDSAAAPLLPPPPLPSVPAKPSAGIHDPYAGAAVPRQ